MQTKFFSLTFPPTIDISKKAPTFEAAQELEGLVNKWLAANPGIDISSVKQDLSFQSPGSGHLVVSIWYEEKRAK
ncbi:MAG: hypothetical protein ACJ76Y_18580 [Thermoanaerobaculia bacterium]